LRKGTIFLAIVIFAELLIINIFYYLLKHTLLCST
jgi:hypothetical protein